MAIETDLQLPPWLERPWASLWQAQQRGRLGHAWLLAGSRGLGKRLFADYLARALLCHEPASDGRPCGVCAECRLLASGHHPDVWRLGPDAESASGEIKVDAVRELVDAENLTAHRGRWKVIQIAPAEAMNRAAANSLLKTLEEPTDRTLLLLIADDATRLAATIRSRCQQHVFLPPPEDQALPWLRRQLDHPPAAPELLLRLSQGAPFKALQLADGTYLKAREEGFREFRGVADGRRDPLLAAATWQASDPGELLDAVMSWLCDIARLCADPQASFLSNPDLREPLAALASRLPDEAVHAFLRQVMRARTLVDSPVNKQLLLESLSLRWAMLSFPQAQHR